MEQAVQQASNEHSQRASQHTNPFTSSELKANAEHNDWCNTQSKITVSSNSTNPFTNSEINASTTHNEECNTPITNIQSSNDTNPFTASELKANIHHNRECTTQLKDIPPSNNTNPLTASELDAILKQTSPQPEKVSSSGATNPIASTELKAMVKHNNQLKSRSEKSTTNNGSKKATEAHSHIADDKDSDKKQVRIQKTCQQRIRRAMLKFNMKTVVNVNTQAIGLSGTHVPHNDGELILNQSQHDVGYSIQIAALPKDQRLTRRNSRGKIVCLDFMFDPSSDFILLCNMTQFTGGPIVIRPLPLSRRSEPLKLGPLGKVPLNCSYGIYAWDEHLFDITIFPRSYISVAEPPSQTVRSNKRPLEPSSTQPSPSKAKRAKLKETTDESNATTIIQTTAQPPPPPANELVAENTISNTDRPDMNIISGICHPLEHLRLGDTVKMVSATQEEDYTVTRKDDISVQTNSIVFKAHHSSFSEKSIAVKVWRSKLDYDPNSKQGVNISTVGKHWLNEVKNHFKVSQHPNIATVFGFDARLLSLYMEHVNAPNLQCYRERGRNPYCTLNGFDAKRVLYGITDALNYIHSKGITHDDIKPANILYSKQRGPVLIDFGWSSSGNVHTAGSPWYIPPEYEKKGQRGAGGDIFALGVVMLFLLGMIPLPELQSPPLIWHISRLRGGGPETFAAVETMNRWLIIVEEAAKEFAVDPDNIGVGGIVAKMVVKEVKRRITGPEIIQALDGY
ncbi:kinase-like domain-containing protein [Trichoderma evansii]